MWKIDISVIIINYNTLDLTIQCINSIIKHSIGVNYEIIVVDNASGDNSTTIIRQKFPMVHIIKNKQNIGFGMANNIGSLNAKGKYLFLLNSDTLLLNNCLKILFDFYEKNINRIKIGVLGGILVDKQGKENESCAHFPKPTSVILKAFKCNIIDMKYRISVMQCLQTKGFCHVDYICGADMFISHELFREANGFSKDYFMYYEESDLQKRISKMNYCNIILGSIKIIHLVGASQNELAKNSKRIILGESMLTYMKRHYSPIIYHSFKYFYITIEILKSFRGKYTFKESCEYIKVLIKK